MTKPEHLFYISETLLQWSQKKEQRCSLYLNFHQHYKKHGLDETLSLKLLQSTNRTISYFLIKKRVEETAEFLENTLLHAINTGVFAPSLKTYEEFLNLISSLAKHPHKSLKIFEIARQLLESISSILTEDLARFNNILIETFTLCTEPTITTVILKRLSPYFKDIKGTKPTVLLEKVTMLVVKLLIVKADSFELSTECFSCYHFLVISLFHVIKNIKNQSGVLVCCDDIKRHKIHNLCTSVFGYAMKLARAKKTSKTLVHNLSYHVNYDFTICNSMKCPEKDSEKLVLYDRMYQVLYIFAQEKSTVHEHIKDLHDFTKNMLTLWDQLPSHLKVKIVAPDLLAWKIHEKPTKESATYSVHGMLMTIRKSLEGFEQSSKEEKKSIMKNMYAIREAVALLGFSTVAGFIKSKEFSPISGNISTSQIILIEICTIHRYESAEKTEVLAKLLPELRKETQNAVILAEACQYISDEVLDKLDLDEFHKMNKLFEQEAKKEFNVNISLALALNNYNIFLVESEALKTSMNELKEDSNKLVTSQQLQSELEALNYLNMSLQHFSDLVCHLLVNVNDMERIFSKKQVSNVLNNIANNFYIRGIKYKDLEAFTLLWNLLTLEKQPNILLLSIATFFLDHNRMLVSSSGNYLKISKNLNHLTIEEILETANKIMNSTLTSSFKNQSSSTKNTCWSYMLRLVYVK